MKILFVNIDMHYKNLHALKKYNFDITYITDLNLDNLNLNNFDIIYSPSRPIDVKKYPNTKFIFGPHFSVYPDSNQMNLISGNNNAIYIQPCEFARNYWHDMLPINCNIQTKILSFGVDTEQFCPINNVSECTNVFIYFKRRDPKELNFLVSFLNFKGIEAKIFNYVSGYSEQEYLEYLQKSKYGIWLGSHESQGFALEEALSMNVPLLVWNVKYLSQEYNSNHLKIPATSIPYWDERCGEYFYNPNELSETFDKFINKLSEYKPREYIEENMSIEKCRDKFIELYNNI
jgi:hypothetical protein